MSKFKSLRLAAGLTQQELADALDMSLRNIQRYDAGELELKSMELEQAIKLADVLKISPRDLI